ncbi:MAG: prepilin-type N-terminal cleavage/methylation domain-containing protein [Thermosipho sp. (in: Bacteria)]|nr:prepilin-type N-terminal cleavage/methylation domain-containing protein [Thermosipho sp. (in: thermotogales)]
MRSGFTLIETLISLLLLFIAFAIAFLIIANAVALYSKINGEITKLNKAQNSLERFLSGDTSVEVSVATGTLSISEAFSDITINIIYPKIEGVEVYDKIFIFTKQ